VFELSFICDLRVYARAPSSYVNGEGREKGRGPTFTFLLCRVALSAFDDLGRDDGGFVT